MAKSLIKTVDGIGIWVRDDAYKDVPFGIREIISIFVNIFISALIVYYTCDKFNINTDIAASIIFSEICICMLIFLALFVIEGYCGFFFRSLPAYKIYPASDMEVGITVFKTTNEKADQLAICKAAKEIESRCHEIAAKRAELDRIAAGCK